MNGSDAKKWIQKNTYKSSALRHKELRLKAQVDGFTKDEFDDAYKELITEGEIYECRTDHWVKKV